MAGDRAAEARYAEARYAEGSGDEALPPERPPPAARARVGSRNPAQPHRAVRTATVRVRR